MKTKFKTTALAIAFVAIATVAFATNISNAINGKKLVDYTWQKYLPDGVTPDGNPVLGTETENPFPSQCNGNGSTICAIGSPVVPGTGLVRIVRYNF